MDANRIVTHLYKLRAIALPKNHVETKEDQGEPCGMSLVVECPASCKKKTIHHFIKSFRRIKHPHSAT